MRQRRGADRQALVEGAARQLVARAADPLQGLDTAAARRRASDELELPVRRILISGELPSGPSQIRANRILVGIHARGYGIREHASRTAASGWPACRAGVRRVHYRFPA